MCFTSDGKFMALAERHSCKDYIGIYYCGDWSLVNVRYYKLLLKISSISKPKQTTYKI